MGKDLIVPGIIFVISILTLSIEVHKYAMVEEMILWDGLVYENSEVDRVVKLMFKNIGKDIISIVISMVLSCVSLLYMLGW